MIALTIVSLRTGDLVLQDTFNDSFVWEIIATYTECTDLPYDCTSFVAGAFYVALDDIDN